MNGFFKFLVGPLHLQGASRQSRGGDEGGEEEERRRITMTTRRVIVLFLSCVVVVVSVPETGRCFPISPSFSFPLFLFLSLSGVIDVHVSLCSCVHCTTHQSVLV